MCCCIMKFKKIIKALQQDDINEEETACIGMEKVLELLGWDIMDINQVRRQQILCGKYKSDYILYKNKRPYIVIELKPAGNVQRRYRYGSSWWRTLEINKISTLPQKAEVINIVKNF